METNNKASNINIFHIIRVFLSYWPILVISSLIFVIAAVFYLSYASKTYSVYARISINTQRLRGTRGSSEYINVNELMNQQKSYSNEVTFLRSTPLIKEVIQEMNLFTSYYVQADKIPKELPFSFHNIYTNSPFIVIVDEDSPQAIGTMFYIQILNENKFVIRAYKEQAYLYTPKDETISNYWTYLFMEGTYSFGQSIQNEYCSFKVLLNSNYDPSMFRGQDLYFKFNSPQILAYNFQKALSVSSAFYESSIADLTFEWENLALAKAFLQKLIDKYIEKNLEKKNFNANNTIAYIERQLENVSGTLGKSERQLQSFRTSQNVMDINTKTGNLYSEIQGLERNSDDVQTQFQNLSRLKTYFKENINSSTFIVPSSMGMSDATLATLIEELTSLSRERQNLISTNQLKNPRIKSLDASIATIKKVITDNISFSLMSVQNELNEINSQINTLKVEYARLPQTQRQLLELEREFNINDEVYSSLLNQRIQAKIMKASTRSDCEIIEPVRYVEITAPSPKKIGVVALFLGLFFPSIYIIIVNFLSQKIRTKEDLSNFCSLPSIGVIPHNDKPKSNVISNYPQEPIVERFHSVRSNIMYYLGEANKTILVTSTLPSEGKSFTSLNLALSFASTNSKTLLIGFDLRKNSKTLEEFKLQSLVGLDLYLMNRATIDEVIIETPYANLDFINNGKIPIDPVALLSSPRIKEMFEYLKSEYDYIVIDTPPFGMVTDAFLLMQHADMNLYVSRLGTITKKALKQSMEELKSKDIKNTYLLTNDILKIDKTYADRYAYGDVKKGKVARLISSIKKMNKKMRRA